MIKLLKNKQILSLLVLSLVFLIVYSILPLAQILQSEVPLDKVSFRFNTPDEVMNYYFTNLYTDSGQLYYEEPLNLLMDGRIFPRWAKPLQEKIVFGSFQGLILIYSFLAKIFGNWLIIFLTPLLAIIGVWFFYGLLKQIFSSRVAWAAAMLMFIFPGFWYYASRTMFHNILFLSLLLGGLYFMLRLLSLKKYKWLNAIIGGGLLGLALITRSSEIIWLGMTVALLLFFNLKSYKQWLMPFVLAMIMVVGCLIPVLKNNQQLYGSWLATGYNSVVAENLEDMTTVRQLGLLESILLPFGFHPRVMVTHAFFKYFIKLFYPWLIFIFGGLLIFLKSATTRQQKMYFWLWFTTSIYLLIYYGSWFFIDSLNPDLVSLGSSYVRYFLPIYVLSLAWVGLFLTSVFDFLKTKDLLLAKTVMMLVGILFAISSYLQVIEKGPDAIYQVKNNLLKYRLQAKSIIEMTGEDDLILTDVSNDKVLFPERKHLIVPQGGDELKEVREILWLRDVWFFYRSADVGEDYLNFIKFNPYGLEISEPQEVEGGGVLFKVRVKEDKVAWNR